MPRIRSVKPEYFGSEPVGNCSPTSRLLFIALWCLADDEGRAVDNPKIIRAFAFPLDDDILSTDVDRMLVELHVARLIVRYEVEGRKYLAVKNFTEHQHPKKKLQSKLPPPPVPHQFPTAPPLVAPVVVVVEGEVVGEQQLPAAVADAPPLALVSESPKPKKPAAEKKAPSFPHFPKSLSDEMHALWVSKFGAVDVGRFRKEFGPLFTVPEHLRGDAPTNAELFAALKSYVNLAPMGDAARFVSVVSAARCLAAIAIARKDHADDPAVRNDAIMRILHGRRVAS